MQSFLWTSGARGNTHGGCHGRWGMHPCRACCWAGGQCTSSTDTPRCVLYDTNTKVHEDHMIVQHHRPSAPACREPIKPCRVREIQPDIEMDQARTHGDGPLQHRANGNTHDLLLLLTPRQITIKAPTEISTAMPATSRAGRAGRIVRRSCQRSQRWAWKRSRFMSAAFAALEAPGGTAAESARSASLIAETIGCCSDETPSSALK